MPWEQWEVGGSYNALYMCYAHCTTEAFRWHGPGLHMFYRDDSNLSRGSGCLQF